MQTARPEDELAALKAEVAQLKVELATLTTQLKRPAIETHGVWEQLEREPAVAGGNILPGWLTSLAARDDPLGPVRAAREAGQDEKQQSETCAGQREAAQPRVELAATKEECTAEELAASQMHAKTQLETEARPPMSEPSSVPAAVAAC